MRLNAGTVLYFDFEFEIFRIAYVFWYSENGAYVIIIWRYIYEMSTKILSIHKHIEEYGISARFTLAQQSF